jgi:hypothetical protein
MARRPAEFHYYDWSFTRWFGSNTRVKARSIPVHALPPAIRELPPEAREFVLDAVRLAAAGAYRELLDYCYNDGEIPGDLGSIANLCGCGPELIEVVFPTFKSKFHASKRRDGKLVNDEVNIRRKSFSEKRKQKKLETSEKPEQKGRRKAKDASNLGHNGTPKENDSVHEVYQEERSKKKEVRSKNDGDEAISDSPPPPLEVIQSYLEQFVRSGSGLNWPPPDKAIAQQVQVACHGHSSEELQEFLLQLHSQKKRPRESYAWFVRVVEDRFGGENGRR